jgi:hypothetical protein
VNVTVPDDKEQPVDELESVFTTVSPDVATAPGAYEPPVLPALGALLGVITFAAYTLMVCVTCAAAAYEELPGSLKFTTQVPEPVNVTLPDDSVQPVDVLSSVIATLSFDVALAFGV